MGSLCFTFDVDWAHDQIIHDTLDLLAEHSVSATIFVTHQTPTLERMQAEGHEIGIHPNFNPILNGSDGNARDIVLDLMHLVPDALSIRSHSLVNSSRLSEMFRSLGLTHESNKLIPQLQGDLGSWFDFYGMIQVPIRWEDDVFAVQPSIGQAPLGLQSCNIHVCDFHPIHLFLNTLKIGDYERTRTLHNHPDALYHHRRPHGSGGARDQFLELIGASDRKNDRLVRCIRPKERDL